MFKAAARLGSLALVFSGAVGCGGGGDEPTVDAATVADAAVTADGTVALDGAVVVDGAVTADARPVDGSVVVDARPVDGTVVVDARPVDAVVVVDAPAGNVGYAGCGTTTAFVDQTNTTTHAIGVSGVAFAYTPPCIRIRVGQSVSFTASSLHPLRPAPTGNPGSEIVAASANATYTLNSTGVYGYYCNNHGAPTGTGMAGAIEVVP